MSDKPKIMLKNLSKHFYTRKKTVVVAFEDISFTVPEGMFLVLVGPSGCGKTTLLRVISGLEEKTSGEIRGIRSEKDKPLNSMVFQQESVLPWMTVRDNIGYGLRMRGVEKKKRKPVVDNYLKLVGLSKFADSYPHQLSGGMKQRVTVARAFANDPEILLMDEPFAALDEQNKILLQ